MWMVLAYRVIGGKYDKTIHLAQNLDCREMRATRDSGNVSHRTTTKVQANPVIVGASLALGQFSEFQSIIARRDTRLYEIVWLYAIAVPSPASSSAS